MFYNFGKSLIMFDLFVKLNHLKELLDVPTHRGQRQTKVCGLMFDLDLDLMQERLDPLLLKAGPEAGKRFHCLV